MIEVARLIDVSLRHTAHALLRGRRSIRYYGPDLPPAEVLDRIFTSAAMAPSAHNRQPWRYVVVTDARSKERLAEVMSVRLAADRRRDGDDEEAIQRDVIRSLDRIIGAPVLIVVAMTLKEMDTYPDESRARAEHLMAVQSTAMATQNLLLAAHAEGLGACWMCAPLFCPSEVRHVLHVPEDWLPQGLITVGYPVRQGRLRPRKAISDFVLFTSPSSDQGLSR
jgi:coenzyme F420-0:L-glutamate ligase / coenzyme F420-1:gamma-L-glutamate ligase